MEGVVVKGKEELSPRSVPKTPGLLAVATPARAAAAPEPASPAAEAPTSPAGVAQAAPASRAAAARPGMSPVPPARPIASAARPGSLRKVAEPAGGLTPVPGSGSPSDAATKAVRPVSAARPKRPPSADRPQSALTCPICLETVAEGEGRSTAALACGHKFHLSCIGSAFNAKGAMVCPLCRREEDDEWRYADGLRPEDDWDPADLGEADAALFYPSDDEYDDEQDLDAEYWCEELPVLWRIHAAPVRYTGDLTDEEEYDDEDAVDDELDDASIDEDFHPHYSDEDEYVGVQRQVFLRGRPMMLQQYVELSNVYDEHAPDEDELDDDSAPVLPSADRTASLSESTSGASAAASEVATVAEAAGDGVAEPIPEDEISDVPLDAVPEHNSARAGASTDTSEEAQTAAGPGAPSLRLRPRHVLHFGRVLSYGGQPGWSDLSFDVDGGVGLPAARYCYVANLELGLLPAER